jgi:hypothetical protein
MADDYSPTPPPQRRIASIKKFIRKRLPHWAVLIRWHRNTLGAFPNIVSPVTFNEKVLHRNLFDRRALLTQFADKAAVRAYVRSRLGPDILPRLYCLTTRPDAIPFDDLPDRFVVKPTHASGWGQLVTNKATLDRAALIALCEDWLKRSYYEEQCEQVYKHVEPRVIVEEFIGCELLQSASAFAFGLEDCANLVDAGHGDDLVVLAAGARRLLQQCLDLCLLGPRDRCLRDLALHIFEFARALLLLRKRRAAKPGEQSDSQPKLPHEHRLRLPSHHRRTPELRLQFLDGGFIKIGGRSDRRRPSLRLNQLFQAHPVLSSPRESAWACTYLPNRLDINALQ